MYRVLMAFAALAGSGGGARAELIFEGLPQAYTAGTPFTFLVRLPGVPALGAYNVELVFAAAGGGVTAAASPPAAGYVFPTAANFLAAGTVGPGSYRLTASDFLLTGPGVPTRLGVNDVLAAVTVTPGSGLTGPLAISVDPDTFQVDPFAGEPYSFAAPAAVVGQAVPAPAGVWLLGVAAVIAGVRRRLAARVRAP